MVVRTWAISTDPTGISGGPPAAARVSLKAVVLPSVPATTAIAPELLTVIEFTLLTAVAARVIVPVLAATEVTTPARLHVSAAVVTVFAVAWTVTAPPVSRPFGRTTGA